jgi:hypothetical protein
MNFRLRLDGLVSRMESFDVDFQVMGSQKLSIADIAFIWFLSVVNSSVSLSYCGEKNDLSQSLQENRYSPT